MSKKKRITDIFEAEEILKTADLNILKKTSEGLPKFEREQLPKPEGKWLPKSSSQELHKLLENQLPKHLEGWTLRKEYITVKGEKYGPYLYAYKKVKGRLHKKYIGKVT